MEKDWDWRRRNEEDHVSDMALENLQLQIAFHECVQTLECVLQTLLGLLVCYGGVNFEIAVVQRKDIPKEVREWNLRSTHSSPISTTSLTNAIGLVNRDFALNQAYQESKGV
ncbi:hypothetical protein DV515_00010629 [Chloebia gouldiae]|uniref:Uncharacterized protein n=1 Tax=Chloebia gouldiae TaxID=44316 RepID=A0A3L8S8W1_CHLGU|nr:hypothetical protein DV515_00010629 [Chloebia gouldiae]